MSAMPKLAGEADERRPDPHDGVDLLTSHKVRRVPSGFQRSLNVHRLEWFWCKACDADELFKHDNLSNPSSTMNIFVLSNQQLSKLSSKRYESRSDLVYHSVKSDELLASFLPARHVGSIEFTVVVHRIIKNVLGVQQT